MVDFLKALFNQHEFHQTQGETAHFTWSYLDEGVLCLTPHQDYEKAVMISAGIHGNETAPIEILEQIFQDIFSGNLPLTVRLLLILGNIKAIRTGERFKDYDINRIFCGGYQHIDQNDETLRAEKLEHVVNYFFDHSKASASRYHYDLHTAIRDSLLPTFALLPYQNHDYDQNLLHSINQADLDAVVYHNAVGKTFTHFTSEIFQAASVTLELGKAKPFGQNDLTQFEAIHQVLRAVIASKALPERSKSTIRTFKVIDSIIKKHDDFKLNLEASAPNFSTFHQSDVIATQPENDYIVQEKEVYILFPNPKVAKGLRAGLILKEIST